jgi:hypothetical protein
MYSEHMKFSDMIEALIAGKRVSRESWRHVDGFVQCDYTQMTISVGGIQSPFSLNTISLIADDWYVLND